MLLALSSAPRLLSQAGFGRILLRSSTLLQNTKTKLSEANAAARHRDQNQYSRYFYPWGVVGWIRPAEDDERAEP
jgi:hypothetical protein